MAIRKGSDYIKALQDGREIWHAGRRIEDVTQHAGFTGTIKTLAGLYNKQHEPEYRDIMASEHEGERISYSFLPPRNAEQLALKRRNIEFGRKPPWVKWDASRNFVAELVVGLLDWIGRTLSRSTTNNGPKVPELFIFMPAAMNARAHRSVL